MQLELNKTNSKAYGVAILYTIAVLLIMFFCKFSTELPVDEDMGLIVDFGYTDLGLGDEEPDSKNEANDISIPAPGNPPFTHKVREKLILQETGDVQIQSIKDKEKDKKVENTKKVDNQSENISKNPTDTKTQPQKENEVNKSAIFTGFKGKGTGTGSQGNRKGDGNMGDLSGTKSDNYLGTNTGLGDAGSGRGMIGSGLKGRKLKSIPKIVDQSNKTGKIQIKVKVDKNGKVISSQYAAQGSSITDSDLIRKCEKNALKATFSASSSKDVDYGVLIYTFIVK